MNFKGHLSGGIVAGGGIVLAAVATGQTDISFGMLKDVLNNPKEVADSLTLLGVYFLITLGMSLFPDLDTASIPQRWFFRGMFILMIWLYYTDQFDLFAVCGFFALSPVLHKHRGWTHWLVTPWLLSLFLAIAHEYYRSKNSWFFGFSWENVQRLLSNYWFYMLAVVVGHYTHLFLDSKYIKNKSGHH